MGACSPKNRGFGEERSSFETRSIMVHLLSQPHILLSKGKTLWDSALIRIHFKAILSEI